MNERNKIGQSDDYAVFFIAKRPGRRDVTGSLWVLFGSALGGVGRYALSGFIARRIGEIFPWGTLLVNISGAFVIGIAAAVVAAGGALPGDLTIRQLVMVGLCGGYTTYSSFSLQTLNLARVGDWRRALCNIVASVVLCLIAVRVGFALGAILPGG
jgi:fluoride exporter